MRVLITGSTYYPARNGQAVFTTHLAEGLARRGHAVTVVVPALREQTHYESNGVSVHALRSLSLDLWHSEVVFSPFPGRVLREIVVAVQPEIVHVQDHYPLSRLVARLGRRCGARLVGTNHCVPDNFKPYLPFGRSAGLVYDRLIWWWVLELYNRLDLVTAPSVTAADILRDSGLCNPVHPISCGVDVCRFRPMPDIDRAAWRQRYGLGAARMLCLYVGRLDGEKGLDVLLRAMQLLNRDDVVLGIAGKGAARPALEELARALGLGDRARFLGFVPDEDLPALLNSADVFVMPSTAELLSIATLEAMACGKPVLVARARALPELVSEGVNGCLFAPGDVADAARCLAQMAAEPERWLTMGAEGRRRAMAHGLDGVLQRYEEIYHLALSTRPSATPSGP